MSQLSSGMSWKLLSICVCLYFASALSCEYYTWNPLVNKKTYHIAALILARGGSKGVKLKNIATVGNHSLLRISVRVLKQVEGVSSIWVSTDHSLIAKEAAKENVNIHWRSPESATDSASSIFAVQEFLKNHPYVDTVCLVQCTSPFVKASYIQKGVNSMVDGEECVFSVSRSYKLRWKEEGDQLVPINFDPRQRPRRQDFRGELIENGMFYMSTRKLIQTGTFQSTRYV